MLEVGLSAALEVVKWIVPSGILKLARYVKSDRHVLAFWKPLTKPPITAVLPPVDIDSEGGGTLVFDFLALLEAQALLASQGKRIEVSRADRCSESDRRASLLSFGGPIPNPLTKHLMTARNLVYVMDGHAITSVRDRNLRIEVERTVQGAVSRDYGLITRIRNPYNPERQALMVFGCYGWGTQAAYRVLTDPASLRLINQQGPFFQAICCCDVDEDRIPLRSYLLDLHPEGALRRPSVVRLDA